MPDALDSLLSRVDRLADAAIDAERGNSGALPPRLMLTRADRVPIERVEWLNLGRTPVGGITLFDGPGGIGKTTFLAAVISGLTKGIDFFTGAPIGRCCSCLIVGVEDRRSLIVQRLKLYGADLERVHFVDAARIGDRDAPLSLPEHIGILERAIIEHDLGAVYIDALFSHIALDGEGRMAQQVRAALQPIGEMCERRNVMLAAMRHWTKSTGSALSRALGSVEFTNYARSVFTFGRHPNDDRLIVCSHTKSNYGKLADSVSFEIVAHDVMDDNGRPWQVSVAASVAIAEGVTSDDLAMRAPADPDEKSNAAEWLRDQLADGEQHLTAAILDAATKARVGSRTTIWRAAHSLRVETGRTSSYPSVGTWRLPQSFHISDIETTGADSANVAQQSLTEQGSFSRFAVVAAHSSDSTSEPAETTATTGGDGVEI